MPHKFFKTARNGLPSRILSDSWNKFKLKAHDVWDMSTEGERVLAVRKKQDTAKVSKEDEARNLQDFIDGDVVFLFLGGKQIQARVASVADGKLSLETDDGRLEDIPSEWVVRK